MCCSMIDALKIEHRRGGGDIVQGGFPWVDYIEEKGKEKRG